VKANFSHSSRGVVKLMLNKANKIKNHFRELTMGISKAGKEEREWK
jgi:hypothetical protein